MGLLSITLLGLVTEQARQVAVVLVVTEAPVLIEAVQTAWFPLVVPPVVGGGLPPAPVPGPLEVQASSSVTAAKLVPNLNRLTILMM
ncbi:MAG: hypothetical protein QJR12_17570 [Mycobacterium sp.]|uniref:hypothetical protein n=1 Tax=Mycobacterium sp. TaxID=1785 RepID=UPI00262C4CEB|nr:hypothetical protein [Mycobacterium sp.]MDI3316002.1 hypothetical protein [Mycobacterium sp.]